LHQGVQKLVEFPVHQRSQSRAEGVRARVARFERPETPTRRPFN